MIKALIKVDKNILRQENLNREVAEYILSEYGTYDINENEQLYVINTILQIPYLQHLYGITKWVDNVKNSFDLAISIKQYKFTELVRNAVKYTININAEKKQIKEFQDACKIYLESKCLE